MTVLFQARPTTTWLCHCASMMALRMTFLRESPTVKQGTIPVRGVLIKFLLSLTQPAPVWPVSTHNDAPRRLLLRSAPKRTMAGVQPALIRLERCVQQRRHARPAFSRTSAGLSSAVSPRRVRRASLWNFLHSDAPAFITCNHLLGKELSDQEN